MTDPTTRETVLGSGAGGPLSAPEPWQQYPGYMSYSGGLVVGSGANQGSGSLNAASLYINGVLVNLSQYFPFTGGTFTGPVTLAADPTNPFDASTKRYVDNTVAPINANFNNFLPLAGGALTGALSLPADPTTVLQAATKQYVDNKFSSIIAINDAPSDGNVYARQNASWVIVTVDAGTF